MDGFHDRDSFLDGEKRGSWLLISDKAEKKKMEVQETNESRHQMVRRSAGIPGESSGCTQ